MSWLSKGLRKIAGVAKKVVKFGVGGGITGYVAKKLGSRLLGKGSKKRSKSGLGAIAKKVGLGRRKGGVMKDTRWRGFKPGTRNYRLTKRSKRIQTRSNEARESGNIKRADRLQRKSKRVAGRRRKNFGIRRLAVPLMKNKTTKR